MWYLIFSFNGSAVQQRTSAVISQQANESFTFNDVILITMPTGVEARRKLKEESKENRKLCERLVNFFGKVESLMNEDEQHNQPETGTKLL